MFQKFMLPDLMGNAWKGDVDTGTRRVIHAG
jgi:hypothetical protein